MSRFLDPRLEKLEPYVPGEQPRNIRRLVKLNTNENPYPPSPGVRQVLADLDPAQLRLYPHPDAGELRQAAAGAWGIEPEQVLAGNGSDEILALCFQAFGSGGFSFADISYGFYQVWADFYGAEYRTIPLKDDFTLDIADYLDQKGTLLLASPNAPTGLGLGNKQLRQLLAADKNRLVIVDEAYADFAAENALPLLAEYDNLLIVRTLSKGYSLAGVRIGFALGSPELIADLQKLKYSFNPYNVNRLSAAVAAAALQDQDYFRECRDKVVAERQRVTADLRKLGFSITDSEANFILAGAHPRLSAADWFKSLRDYGVITRYFSKERIANYLRISIGTYEDNQILLKATEEILAKA